MFYLTHLIVGWRIPKKYLSIGVSGVLVFLLLQPLFLLYRGNRYRNNIMAAIRVTYEASEPTDGLGTMFYSGMCAAFERMPGVDVVGQLIKADIRPQGLAALQQIGGVSSVVTYDGYGLSPNSNTSNSPSFVGFWYVLGGEILVYFGTAAFVLGIISFWRWIQGINVCRRWRVGFLIPVLTATLLIDLFGEGWLDNDMMLRKVAAGIVAVVFAETVLCFGEPRVRKVLRTDG
jgi:hypothetical protein